MGLSTVSERAASPAARGDLDRRTLVAYLAALKADPCAYCGAAGGQLDHIDAAHNGGGDGWDNLTGACRGCNLSKGRKSLLGALGWRFDTPAIRVLQERRQPWAGVGV